MIVGDLNLLHLLEVVESHRSVTAAANELHLTQSAVSHALRRLREQIGDPLFVRQGNVMVPTPKTVAIIGPIRQALQQMKQTLDQASAFDPSSSRRRFSIGLLPVAETGLVGPMVRELIADAPSISIDFVRIDHRVLEQDLAGNRLDVAVDVALPVPTSVRRERAWADHFIVVAARDHPVADDGRIDQRAYLAAGHVLVSARRRGAGSVDLAVQKMGFRRDIRFRCQSHQAAAEIAAVSDLLLTVPASAAAAMVPNQQLSFLAPPVELPQAELFTYWHERSDADPANAWLRRRIHEGFEQRRKLTWQMLPAHLNDDMSRNVAVTPADHRFIDPTGRHGRTAAT